MDAGPRSHFDLLRAEHLLLSSKYTELQKNHDLLLSSAGKNTSKGFTSKLRQLSNSLHSKKKFSDVTLEVDGQSYPGHKFIISVRTSYFEDLETKNSILFNDIPNSIFEIVYKWMYTDDFDDVDDNSLLKIGEFASRYKFEQLQELCELLLTTRLDISNCVSIFEFADKEGFTKLRDDCAALVAARWQEFTKDHFKSLSATLLFRLLKGNSSNVLNSIIELEREDVLFLYFIENDSQLKNLLNNESSSPSPLELALNLKSFNIANQLIEHGANVDMYFSNENESLLGKMIKKGNVEACCFLSEKGVSFKPFNLLCPSPLQVLAKDTASEALLDWGMEIISKSDLEYCCSSPDLHGRTALALACLNSSSSVEKLIYGLLENGANPNSCDNENGSPLGYSLLEIKRLTIARKLIECGANVNQNVNENPIIFHLLNDIEAFDFFVEFKPNLDAQNSEGSPLIHCIIESFKHNKERSQQQLITVLKAGINTNVLNKEGDTPLHVAIKSDDTAIKILQSFGKDSIDWTILDKEMRSPLKLALENNNFSAAEIILAGGAPVDELNSSNETLFLQTVKAGNDEVAVFLLAHKANHTIRDVTGTSCLELALSSGMSGTVKALCGAGANVNERSVGGRGFVVLERAITSGHLECASLLVSFGCDLESWTTIDESEQTLLHHMLDIGNQDAAVFLIENGCNVNVKAKYKNPTDDDGQTPLHMAVAWGLSNVVKALIERNADLNVQDVDGRTASHIAIREGNREALALLLEAKDVSFIGTRDKLGQTPLSLAIARRDHQAAAEIVNRQPHAALQTNGNGENLLHVAVRTNDLESVLFLLGTHTDPTRTTQDSRRCTALHLAALADNDLIMRNLILAGCVIDARTSDGSTPLHEAARAHRADLLSILLENQANTEIIDEKGDTVFLTAVRSGSVACVKALLTDTNVHTHIMNKISQTALHICASLPSNKVEDSYSAGDLCEIILNYDYARYNEKDFISFLEARDEIGNTALLIAYMNGNAAVCRSLLKRGASLGARNIDGVTVFTYEMPTKQLLFGLLESLEREPRWSEGDACDCGAKFSITQRKHHCRHCGRVVCSVCSATSMPIVKFGEEKKVRICNLCALVLTQGSK